MSEIHHPSMELEPTTYHCNYCDCEISTANQLTHEVACARLHRNAPQRDQRDQRDQRAPAAQPIVRQSSSSALADQSRAQPQPKREERRVAENKLVTCPNCEKSVREQDINSHMDNECLKNEMIPCEFCDDAIPMSDYSQHVENCPRRSQNNNRPVSPQRERPSPMLEESDDFPHEEEEEHNERDRSPERGSSQGGVRGFFRNIAHSAAEGLRNYNESLQRQAQERQQQREEEQRRQQEMIRQMFGQLEVPRPMSNQNALVPFTGGQRVVRTVERGPFGTVIVRSRVIPSDQLSMGQGGPIMMNGMGGMGGMDPMEMLFGMMNGRMGGMHAIDNGEMPGQSEERGLDQETIDSLALVKYSNEMNKNVDEESRKCPICLEQFEEGQEVRFLWCMHRFHKNCVDQWLGSHTNCPICKKDFSEADASYSP